MSRNQVIPMGINQKDSIDIILERVEHFLIGSKDPNLSLEIEGKLGNFSLKKESNRDIFSILEKFSCQNFIILDESLYKFEKNFNSGIEERLFFNLLDYFKRLYSFAKIYLINNNENDPWKEYYSHLTREVKELISVDYVLGNCNKKKQRLTYDIGSGLSYIEKTTKVNFDLLHNKNHLRLSINHEEKKDFNQYLNLLQECKSIRIKHRTKFSYQFFEFHFTEVLFLKDGHPEFKKLLNPINDETFDLKLLNLFSSNRETIYEVEVELTELEFLKQSLSQRDQFRSVFLRFLRNLESLYLGREALFEPYYSKFCSGAPREIPKPLCGDYMMNEAIKNEKLKKKIMNKINK